MAVVHSVFHLSAIKKIAKYSPLNIWYQESFCIRSIKIRDGKPFLNWGKNDLCLVPWLVKASRGGSVSKFIGKQNGLLCVLVLVRGSLRALDKNFLYALRFFLKPSSSLLGLIINVDSYC